MELPGNMSDARIPHQIRWLKDVSTILQLSFLRPADFDTSKNTLDKSRRRDTLSSLSFLCYKCITVTVDSLP